MWTQSVSYHFILMKLEHAKNPFQALDVVILESINEEYN